MGAQIGTVIFTTEGDFVPGLGIPLSLPSTIVQFAAGIKTPSTTQLKQIEDTIPVLAYEVKSVGLSAA